MIIEYVEAALSKARYEKLKDKKEPYYGEIPVLKGVWATGKTLESCRSRLSEVVEGWLMVRIRKGLPIPSIGKYRIQHPKELKFGT